MLGGKRVPVESWDEQRSFHKALLMAAKVRADLAELFFELHGRIWRDCNKLAFEDSEEYTPQEIWTEKEIGRDFWLDNDETRWISLSVIIHDQDLRAYCCVGKPDDNFEVPKFLRSLDRWSDEKPGSDWINAIYSPPISLASIANDFDNALEPLLPATRQILNDVMKKQKGD